MRSLQTQLRDEIDSLKSQRKDTENKQDEMDIVKGEKQDLEKKPWATQDVTDLWYHRIDVVAVRQRVWAYPTSRLSRAFKNRVRVIVDLAVERRVEVVERQHEKPIHDKLLHRGIGEQPCVVHRRGLLPGLLGLHRPSGCCSDGRRSGVLGEVSLQRL